MFQIELDTVDLGNRGFRQYLRKHKIAAVITNPAGPGGGHAIVRYTAMSRKTLEALIRERFAVDTDLADLIRETR